VACAQVDCLATGACCLLDGSCSAQSRLACRLAGGWYGGDGSSCGAGVCPTVYTYTGNPVAIVDNQCTALNTYAEITVPDSVTINSADASFVLPHTFQADLRFVLVHVESGSSAILVSRQGGGADNFGDPVTLTPIRFIDQGAYRYAGAPLGPIVTATASPTGDWLPGQALAAFNGESSAGRWRLYGQDCAGADTGSIVLFKLAIKGPSAPACYANCDASTAVPVLNVADFTCFLTKYAASDPYANCDASTAVPVLNVADFTCFLTKYAAGCP
jgi:subtilisin-like proprotein convertase family protein